MVRGPLSTVYADNIAKGIGSKYVFLNGVNTEYRIISIRGRQGTDFFKRGDPRVTEIR